MIKLQLKHTQLHLASFLFSRKARRQLDFEATENAEDSPQPQPQTNKREKLIVKLPVLKKQKAEPKSKGRGKGGKGRGKGGRSAHGRGRGRGRGCNTSSEISTNGFNCASVTAPPHPQGRRGRGRGNTTKQSYPVLDYVAVVKQKGFKAPEDPLAVQLAKYFQEKTEIEYNMIVDKMKDVPEDDILRMLGIDPNKETDNYKAKEAGAEADDKETIEQEAEVFMKELSSSAESEKQKGKEDSDSTGEGKANAATKQRRRKEKSRQGRGKENSS